MIIGHSVGVAAAMAAAAQKANPSAPANVNSLNLDAFHALLVADNQTLVAGGSSPQPPYSVCELGRCLGADEQTAKTSRHFFNDSTCGVSTRGSQTETGCSRLAAHEWLANQMFWTRNSTIGSVVYATSDTILKKSTVNSKALPPTMQLQVKKGSGCTLTNGTTFASYYLCVPT
jgi:hypothetical protein